MTIAGSLLGIGPPGAAALGQLPSSGGFFMFAAAGFYVQTGKNVTGIQTLPWRATGTLKGNEPAPMQFGALK